MSVFQDVYALGSVYIDQNLVVKGTTTSVNTKNLEVKDQFIGLGVGNAMETTTSATGLLAVSNVSPLGNNSGYQVSSINPVGNTITLNDAENFFSATPNNFNITFQLINGSSLNNALNTGIYSTSSYTVVDGKAVLTILTSGVNGFRSSLEQEDSTITSNYKLYITDLTKTATVGSVMTVTTYENKISTSNWINYEEKIHTVLYDGDINISNEILKTQIQIINNFPAEYRVTTYTGTVDGTVTLPTPVDGLIKTIINASAYLLTITPTVGSTCEIASLIGNVNMRVTLLYSSTLTKWIIV